MTTEQRVTIGAQNGSLKLHGSLEQKPHMVGEESDWIDEKANAERGVGNWMSG